jgi:DNA-binding beta-propeller fold protein YncE
VINGATNATATVGVGQQPVAIAVNAATNKIYVVNSGDTVTVISS